MYTFKQIRVEDLEHALRESLEELQQHAYSVADVIAIGQRPRSFATVSIQDGDWDRSADPARLTSVRLSIEWASHKGEMKWDEWEFSSCSGSQVRALLEMLRRVGLEVESAAWRPRPQVSEKTTWRFHPERLRALMPFEPAVAEAAISTRGMVTTSVVERVAGIVSAAVQRRSEDSPLRARMHWSSSRRETRRLELLLFHAAYAAKGRQIFEFPPDLVEMFRETSVDEITAESIHLPYGAFYLHFGEQPNMEVAPGWRAEGAYVVEVRDAQGTRQALQFALACAPQDLSGYAAFEINIEPTYIHALSAERLCMPLSQALEERLQEKLAQLREEVGEPVARELADPEVASFAAEAGVHVQSSQKRGALEELATVQRLHSVYGQMMRLVVNALAFMSAYPEDRTSTWVGQPPSFMVKKAERGDRADRRRVSSEISRLGFSSVTLCGGQLAADLRQRNECGGADRKAHWRRGHWRNQAHGPNLSLRKLIWLMPTLVAPTEGIPEMGHIYRVRERG